MQTTELFKVIEQGKLGSIDDITRLNFIDFKRTNGHWEDNIYRAIQATSNLLVNTTAYTVVEIDLKAFPVRDDWSEWGHIGNHEGLGKLYWNFFFYEFEGYSSQLRFADMPDFTGSFIDKEGKEHTIYGDVGQVSVSTFAVDVLPRLRCNDLWVSVLDERRQIILEPFIDISDAFKAYLEELYRI